jgi:hypothetical protein
VQAALKVQETPDHQPFIGTGRMPAPLPMGLSPLELEVVAIGRADAQNAVLVRSGNALVERVRDIACLVTGQRRAKPLADPKLEALRRFAQQAALAREQITDIIAMRDAGYATPQIVMTTRLARGAAGTDSMRHDAQLRTAR